MVYNPSNPAMLITDFPDYKTLEKVKRYLKKLFPDHDKITTMSGNDYELFFADASLRPPKNVFDSVKDELTKKYKVKVEIDKASHFYDFFLQRNRRML